MLALASVSVLAHAVGAPEDWSHRYLVNVPTDSAEEALRKGPNAVEARQRSAQDARVVRQQARRQQMAQAAGNPFTAEQLRWARRFDHESNRHDSRPNRGRDAPSRGGGDSGASHRDWSQVLGGTGGSGRAGVFPAKYNFDVNATPSCANDFVVYTTNAAGAMSTGNFASRSGNFSANPANGETVTITRANAPALVLTASNSLNTNYNFQIGANTTATATNLAAAIVRNGPQVGVTATSNSGTVTVTSLTAGTASNSVTLVDGMGNDFNWVGGTLTGGTNSAGQPTIVAFNQMYRSCVSGAQPLPRTFWSYNTGTGTVAHLSPVLSFDATQVAFVQRASNVASLVLLKWSSASPGTIGAPTSPNSVAPASYRNCTAPCMTVMTFNGSPNNTYSSPFYDYIGDDLYVGDDAGRLHKFNNVFKGTPSEETSGFPSTVSNGNMLSSPVYDRVTGRVFVGSDFASGSSANGGRLHAVLATTGAVTSSAQLGRRLSSFTDGGDAVHNGVRDAPVVDSQAGRVYVFTEAGTDSDNCNGNSACKTVLQMSASFAAGNSFLARAEIGRGEIWYRTLYGGMFDNTYFSSANSASPTGYMYICGAPSDETNSQQPTLWRIPITNNAMGTPQVGPTLTTVNASDCSPVTMIQNGANEYLFASTPQSITYVDNTTPGTLGTCVPAEGTCLVYVFNTAGTWNASKGTAATPLQALGGTGGIIVDNIGAAASGFSQIYFANQGMNGVGNAVQASQATLN